MFLSLWKPCDGMEISTVHLWSQLKVLPRCVRPEVIVELDCGSYLSTISALSAWTVGIIEGDQ